MYNTYLYNTYLYKHIPGINVIYLYTHIHIHKHIHTHARTYTYNNNNTYLYSAFLLNNLKRCEEHEHIYTCTYYYAKYIFIYLKISFPMRSGYNLLLHVDGIALRIAFFKV